MRAALLAALLAAPGAGAQDGEAEPCMSAFMGFDTLLLPYAVRWECGADPAGDIAAFEAIVASEPNDCGADGLIAHISSVRAMASGDGTIFRDYLGLPRDGALSPAEREGLCAAARRLPPASVFAAPEAAETRPEAHGAAFRDFAAAFEAIAMPETE